MIDFPTTPTGGVRSERKLATDTTPTTTRLGGVGVWCVGISLKIAGEEATSSVGPSRPQIQAGCRPANGGAS